MLCVYIYIYIAGHDPEGPPAAQGQAALAHGEGPAGTRFLRAL